VKGAKEMPEVTVDSLIEFLKNENQGSEMNKTAFSKADVEDANASELMNKIAQSMDADEILKQAAAARVSGNIMADVILEKFAHNMGPVIAHAVHEKIASLLPDVVAAIVPAAVQCALEKIAIGTSSAMSGSLSRSVTNDGPANELQMSNDKVDRSGKDRVAPYLHNDTVEGAQVSGGSSPEGGAGYKPEGWGSIAKLSAAKAQVDRYMLEAEHEKDVYLAKVASAPNCTKEAYKTAKQTAKAYIKEAKANALTFLKQAELEADLARYQELEAKAQAGTLSPAEQQEMDMIRQKLMAAAQSAQGGAGGPPPGGPPAGGPPAGGPPPGGSMGDEEKMAAVRSLLNQYGLTR
jgi:hypothetical protein